MAATRIDPGQGDRCGADVRNVSGEILQIQIACTRPDVAGRKEQPKKRPDIGPSGFGDHLAIVASVETIEHHAVEARDLADHPHGALVQLLHGRRIEQLGGRAQRHLVIGKRIRIGRLQLDQMGAALGVEHRIEGLAVDGKPHRVREQDRIRHDGVADEAPLPVRATQLEIALVQQVGRLDAQHLTGIVADELNPPRLRIRHDQSAIGLDGARHLDGGPVIIMFCRGLVPKRCSQVSHRHNLEGSSHPMGGRGRRRVRRAVGGTGRRCSGRRIRQRA
jgi:hypothetical protein